MFLAEWGSEIQPFKIQKYLKSGLFGGQILNGQALAMAKAIVPTNKKPDHQNSKCFFFWISNVF